jgi:hypothetical protein
VPEDIVYRLSVVDKSMVLVRLENLADKFDGGNDGHFDLEKFASELYVQSNPGKKAQPHITEMAIDGVQTKAELDQVLAEREQWQSEDGQPQIEAHKVDTSPLNNLTLEP